ncbi:MAG: hypothetical protein M3340_03665 [Actinomycetota bacterium]|nr:hypothetical protein [Actinomycetota bacterium]
MLVRDHTVEVVEFEEARIEDTLVRTPEGDVVALGGYCESLGIAREAVPARPVRLLSYGANASPEELARKLAGRDPVVPVVLTERGDIDVVFSAHASPRGGLGAAVQRSPGTWIQVAVTYLREDLIGAIDATEENYDRIELPGVGAEVYVSKHGCLVLDGSQVALAAVPARGRRFPAMTTIEAVDAVRRLIAPDRTLDRFVWENATDARLRAERTAVLRETAMPFGGRP